MTVKTFPAWVSDVDAYRIVRGTVEEVLQPFREEANRKKAEQARQEEEAARKRREREEGARQGRRIQELIDDGMRYARSEKLFDWESEDRDRALRDVERMLKDDVQADWTEQDVKDAVNDELDEEIDIHEAAREKGVCEETIRRAVRDGRIPDRRANPKGRHRVRRGDLNRVAETPGLPYDPVTDAQGIAQLRRKL